MLPPTSQSKQPDLICIICLTWVILAVTTILNAQEQKQPQQTKKPNVLFICIDDMNDWIEPLGGHPQANTPNLTRLAERSITFTRAFCAAPACNPSRVATMTGIHCHNSGVYRNEQVWREALPNAKTLPQYFADQGYYTAGAGKIFHNNMPDPQSWQDYFPSKIRHMPSYYYPKKRPATVPFVKGNYVEFDWGPIPKKDEETGDYRSVDWICQQLKREHDKPFFLACGIYRPHVPWFVPKKYFKLHPVRRMQTPPILSNDLDDIPPRGRWTANGRYHRLVMKHDLWKSAVQGYAASVTFADMLVGKLLDELDKSPHRDNTIIVLWSDHGWMLGEKEHWRKFALWEQACRVPLFIYVPKGIKSLPDGSPSGRRCGRVVSLVDLYPTLVQLCDLPDKKGLDGRSLVPLLNAPSMPWDHPAITHNFERGDVAVTTEQWRYILYKNGDEELYDYQGDETEWYNLAKEDRYQSIKDKLKSTIPKLKPEAKTDYKGYLEKYKQMRQADRKASNEMNRNPVAH